MFEAMMFDISNIDLIKLLDTKAILINTLAFSNLDLRVEEEEEEKVKDMHF